MRRLVATIALAAACAAGAAACRKLMPTTSLLQPRSAPRVSMSTADARSAFSHDGHAKVFAAAEVDCIDCHRFDFVIDTGDQALGDTLSAHALYPGSVTCHFCHADDSPGKMAAAPSTCTNCHVNLAALRPENHEIAWLKVHAVEARGNPVECEKCHRQSYCIDCHERRDDVQTIAHERNFRFLHGIEARADPMKCSACHREDFCINCHLQGQVQP